MKNIVLIAVVFFVLYACKTEKKTEVAEPAEQTVDQPQYAELDSNIILVDSVKIESIGYRKLEGEKNIEIKIVFNDKALPYFKSREVAPHLFILLYPLKEEQIDMLPADRKEFKFDNWTIYDLQNLEKNEVTYQANTQVFEFAKIELGLFDLKNDRFGNMYMINNVYFQ